LGDAGPPLGTISLMITGDEEGPAINGTAKLLAWALSQGNQFDASLVGEPTCRTQLGDTIKIGRRGSLSGTIRVTGQQGHAAYPHLADNPVPRLIRLVHRLSELQLDQGSEDFQPSNLEVTSIDVGNPAFNVIPSEAGARFNVRFNDHWSVDSLTAFIRSELAEVADGDRFAFEVAGRPSEWFLTRSEALIGPLTAAIGECTGQAPELTTGGGTSDARFFKDVCPVVEFGLVGDTIHQIDERVPIDDLTVLARTYQGFLRHYFSTVGDA
ncbi:MAG: succinyl-diaminopimelate desuccinylase, partial [Hyphomicrobiales bacterium]|nr:succinyl-diaminopimelate desuccinylase [Hyphomicrobiales bacterium]